MAKIVRIQFTTAGKLYDFTASKANVKAGDRVIVETERGKSIGQVVAGPIEVDDALVPEGTKPVQRLAELADLATLAANTAKEKEAHKFCLARIKERNMDMKLVKVEYLFDGSKAIFYFTADGRVDFRELVKDLAHAFHTRIEMRQIGVRDESKMVGGIGICGRELCCSSYLREFEPVSVKMAKEQNLALNPSKISGQCGRLLCCLSYEFDTYCSLRKGLPKCGKRVQCGCHDGEVVKVNVLEQTVTLKTADDSLVVLKGEDIAPENISDRVKKPPQGKGEQQGGDKGKSQGPGKQRRNRPVDVKERKKEKPQ
ncbi:stage 0 sporulation family protein [Geomonas sp. Red69]|uniref:Stage 0 sporulation family protein n=1 Tax=Geomonas diazotrophica TaxID=2843197 RepID=A0ABX8JMX3_9BACT|nr:MULTISPECIES: stage 0 sporulation family protein [Geomonas]MBU5636749.1 stage 0 sporulation family protein [Geomonas diazotrophica]QWV98441.1 stage 0 sporulation family protein [Geomonas nitrogeniifigens]QXE87623.1 stage 0 sporulation family protein [Geomonas nitrogeniifigens]